MKRIVIFAGTTEGRSLSEGLAGAGIGHTVCVATEYGKTIMKDDPKVDIRSGRLTEEEMEDLFESSADIVYDATHPFARIVTENIVSACNKTRTEYVRILRRDAEGSQDAEGITFFDSIEECAAQLAHTSGNILLTTGSKDLQTFAADEGVAERLFVRVLPSEESIHACRNAGILPERIIAMQGPFSQEMNEVLMRHLDISCLVTKQSGVSGGYVEKLAAAQELGINVFVIGKPEEEDGIYPEDVLAQYGIERPLQLSLIGCGPGDGASMTLEAQEVLKSADIVFGAARLLEHAQGKRTYPYYLAKDILPVLERENIRHAAVLFSGDSGFFSGAEKMNSAAAAWAAENGRSLKVRILPGISSISYLAARAQESYQDYPLVSLHGRTQEKDYLNAVDTIRRNEKVFVIFSGAESVRNLAGRLVTAGCSGLTVILGYQLSYPQEEIATLSAKECYGIERDGLYAAIIKNPSPEKRRLIPLVADEELLRADPEGQNAASGKSDAPMTKEMIRHVSIMRLNLSEGDILYDVGSGTGSISVEAAGLDPSVTVYAIEKKEAAAHLTRLNAEKFSCGNIIPVKGTAPEAFEGLPVPTHVFIGGSDGHLKEILNALRAFNKEIRVVINAVSLETIAEVNDVIHTVSMDDLRAEQISVSKARTLGSYHLMMADNPVMIVSFTLRP